MPLASVGICAQDSVVVSREDVSWVAVCTGFVKDIYAKVINIHADR